MGNTVWVLSDNSDEDDWDHSLMLANEESLNKLADQLSIKRLSDFYDHSILAEEYGEEIEPNFVSADVLEGVLTSLIAAIRDGNLETPNLNPEILEELIDCLEKVLAAKNCGSKVRLALIP